MRTLMIGVFGLALGAATACDGGGVKTGTCTYDGVEYQLYDTFDSTDGCNTCSCEADGAVSCTEEACETGESDTGESATER